MPDVGPVSTILQQTPAASPGESQVNVKPETPGSSTKKISETIDVLGTPGTPNVGAVSMHCFLICAVQDFDFKAVIWFPVWGSQLIGTGLENTARHLIDLPND